MGFYLEIAIRAVITCRKVGYRLPIAAKRVPNTSYWVPENLKKALNVLC